MLREHGLLLSFPWDPATCDNDKHIFLDPILQGLHHERGKPSQNWKAQENEGCRHEEGFQRASKNSVIPPRTCVVEKEARRRKHFPQLCSAMSLVRGWEEGNDSIPVLRELPAVGRVSRDLPYPPMAPVPFTP